MRGADAWGRLLPQFSFLFRKHPYTDVLEVERVDHDAGIVKNLEVGVTAAEYVVTDITGITVRLEYHELLLGGGADES